MTEEEQYGVFYQRMMNISPTKFMGHYATLQYNLKRGIVSKTFASAMESAFLEQEQRAIVEEEIDEARERVMIENARTCDLCSIYCVHKQPFKFKN